LLRNSSEPSRTGVLAGDVVFTSGIAEWLPNQDLALVGSKSRSPTFAGQRPHGEDDPFLDVPLFPDARLDGQSEQTFAERVSTDPAVTDGEYITTDPKILDD